MPTKTTSKSVAPPPKRVSAAKKPVSKTNGDGKIEDNRVQLQFRLTTELRDRLRYEAERRDVSVNFLIERALDEGLLRWEKEKLRG